MVISRRFFLHSGGAPRGDRPGLGAAAGARRGVAAWGTRGAHRGEDPAASRRRLL